MRADEIRGALEGGGVLLTPNLRSARQWRRRLTTVTGAPAIPSNRILPWRAWTSSLWQEVLLRGIDDRVLLSDMQCATLWEEVIRAASPATLRPMRSLVKLCLQAHTLAESYRAVDHLLAPVPELGDGRGDSRGDGHANDLSDAGHFRIWLAHLRNRCRTERLLPAAALDLATASERVLSGLRDHLPPQCIVFGFDRLTPAQEALLAPLVRHGMTVRHIAASAAALQDSTQAIEPAPPVLVQCGSERDEYTLLAQALRSHMLVEPGSSMAVIVPDLDNSRNALETALRQTVAPEMLDVAAARRSPPWELSMGLPLASVPIIADALRLLHWANEALPIEDLSSLLQSPYVGFAIAPDRAATLDAHELRRGGQLRPEWPVEALCRRCAKDEPDLRNQLYAWARTAAEATRGQQIYGGWTETVRLLLHAIGWPGNRERTSMEFQTVDRWNDLLDSMASLDTFDRVLPYREFLTELHAWTAETLFAPENTGAPIQIMTVAEAAGSTFDRLWFLHADETRLNARSAPNPLLSWALQQSMGMPGTDPARDAERAFATVERIAASASEVRFSYAAVDAEGTVRPSPLAESLPGLLRTNAAIIPEARETPMLEPYEPDAAVPLAVPGPVSGGASVLQSQASCAFRAFAEKRLFSTEVDSTDLGLDQRERGTLVHRVLENFWAEVQSQAALLKLRTEGALESTLQRHIDMALPSPSRNDGWSTAYLEIQRERLRRLLGKWLAFEAERPPFEVIFREENVANVEIGPLRVDVRVDRVDRVLSDGESGVVLIDYKTGSKDQKSWLDDRPDEPQLPLYAIAAGIAGVQAIAYGIVKPGEKNLGLRSLPARNSLLDREGIHADEEVFPLQMEKWRTTLERLAEEFAAGEATVAPKEYPATCTYCAQRMLCRLNPEVLESLAEEDAMAVLD